jgi:hypothetical protein
MRYVEHRVSVLKGAEHGTRRFSISLVIKGDSSTASSGQDVRRDASQNWLTLKNGNHAIETQF